MKHPIRKVFMSGLLVWLPILATYFTIRFVVNLLDRGIGLLPQRYRPESWLGIHIPGFGVVVSIVVVIITGIIVTNFLGKYLLSGWEDIIKRIPLVRVIYTSVKQVLETLFSTNGESFRKVLLVEYPRRGLWSVALQTAEGGESIAQYIDAEGMVTIFIPTTPNPTSGFLMIVPRKDTIELDMKVDEALKFIVSLGVIQPMSKTAADNFIQDKSK